MSFYFLPFHPKGGHPQGDIFYLISQQSIILWKHKNMVLNVVFIIFCGAVLILLAFDFFLFTKLAGYPPYSSLASNPGPVSVIICAKNEEKNLAVNLPLILGQQYPDFEVVVINDGSTDRTIELIKGLMAKYANLKTVSIDDNMAGGKKYPLQRGIEFAKNNILLLTDADCKPVSDQWLNNMASHFIDGVEIVLGYSPFEKIHSLFNYFARCDGLFIGIQYLSLAIAGFPYMGVGRNLAYKKSLYGAIGGFDSHRNILSGDDDLFVNKAATRFNTRIEPDKIAQTVSEPPLTFQKWFFQKRRHTSTGRYYKTPDLVILGVLQISILLFYLLLILLLYSGYMLFPVLALTVIRGYSHYLVLKKCTRRLGEQDLLLFSLLFELPIVILSITAALSNLVIKNSKWK